MKDYGEQRREEKIKIIARYYGYEAQSRQLIEEMAELTQAINKLWRKENYGGSQEDIKEAYESITEEMADTCIMIQQLKELLSIGETELFQIIDRKVDRQIGRIQKEAIKC